MKTGMTLRKQLTLLAGTLVLLSTVLAGIAFYNIETADSVVPSFAAGAVREYGANCWKHMAASGENRMRQLEQENEYLGRGISATFQAHEKTITQNEDRRGMDQTGKAVSQLDHVTQTNAASAQESDAAAQELNAQSETVRAIVERLALLVGGHIRHNATARHYPPIPSGLPDTPLYPKKTGGFR